LALFRRYVYRFSCFEGELQHGFQLTAFADRAPWRGFPLIVRPAIPEPEASHTALHSPFIAAI